MTNEMPTIKETIAKPSMNDMYAELYPYNPLDYANHSTQVSLERPTELDLIIMTRCQTWISRMSGEQIKALFYSDAFMQTRCEYVEFALLYAEDDIEDIQELIGDSSVNSENYGVQAGLDLIAVKENMSNQEIYEEFDKLSDKDLYEKWISVQETRTFPSSNEDVVLGIVVFDRGFLLIDCKDDEPY